MKTDKNYNLPLNLLKTQTTTTRNNKHCAILPSLCRHCQSKAQQNMGPSKKLTFDLESGVRVTCDVGYLCANISFPRPLCSPLRPDVRDRQTSDAHQPLMPHILEVGHIDNNKTRSFFYKD